MLSIADKVRCLELSPIFAGQAGETLEQIARKAAEVDLVDGQMLFREGDDADSVYLLISGKLLIHSANIEFCHRGQGEIIGELALLNHDARSASATSVGRSSVLRLTSDDFFSLLRTNVDVGRALLKTIAERLRSSARREIEVAQFRQRMLQDLERARELQVNILPREDLRLSLAGGMDLEIAGYCRPAESVGGDYYDFFPLSDHQVAIAIGDVMGHGFHSGLLVFTAKSCLHTQIRADSSISGAIAALNRLVYNFAHGEMFMSFCYLIIDTQQGHLSFLNAGHPSPTLLRTTAPSQTRFLDPQTCPLGIQQELAAATTTMDWQPDDMLVLYTDGIVEAESPSGEVFGSERLHAILAEHVALPPRDLINRVLDEFVRFTGREQFADDISLVVAKCGKTPND
jgi:serine phosphatase RsbU (regulator of sigma subunit)